MRVKTKPPSPERISTPASVKPTIAQRGKFFEVAPAAIRCWRRCFRWWARGVVPVVAGVDVCCLDVVVAPEVVVRPVVRGGGGGGACRGGGGGAGAGGGGGALVVVVVVVPVVWVAVSVAPVESLGAAETPPASAKPASASPAATAAASIGWSNRLVRMLSVFSASTPAKLRVMAIEGSCLCGGVRFELTGEFEPRSFCHCASCKRISGGVGTANGWARSDSIRIVAGQELLHTYQPEEGSAKTFCSVCGSNLFGAGWPESEIASVRLPAIDTPFEGHPSQHTYTRSVADWETLPEDGLERFEGRASS